MKNRFAHNLLSCFCIFRFKMDFIFMFMDLLIKERLHVLTDLAQRLNKIFHVGFLEFDVFHVFYVWALISTLIQDIVYLKGNVSTICNYNIQSDVNNSILLSSKMHSLTVSPKTCSWPEIISELKTWNQWWRKTRIIGSYCRLEIYKHWKNM